MGKRANYFYVIAISLGMLLWSENLFAISTAPYYPIQFGNSWTYDNTVSGTYTVTIPNETAIVNGVPTSILQDSNGLISYVTNDQFGIRLHRQFDPAVWFTGLGYRSLDVIYNPPMQLANAETYIGDSIYSTGTAETTVSGLGIFYLTYTITSSIDSMENVSVPAGTYQAVKNSQTVNISGNVLGSYQSSTTNSFIWLAKDIGEVKYWESSAEGVEEEVLTITNVVPKVTPTAGTNGSIVPSTPQYVPFNETVSFSITPAPYYLIESVTGCGGTLINYIYTTVPITADCTVAATFYPLEYSVSAEFVRQVYLDFLNREPDLDGLYYWVSQLENGTLDRPELVEQYLLSPEFQGNIAPIARLYFAYFLRIPDYGGLMYWIDQFKQGLPLAAISEGFTNSSEFQQLYGSLSNSDFVALVYQNVLGRDPDPSGLDYWTSALDSGVMSRGEVMVGFSESTEYKSLMAEEIYVTMTYIGLLRRAPEQEGFDYWVGLMESGTPGVVLIDGFLNSSEYADRFR